MNGSTPNRPVLPYAIAIVGTFLIIAVLVWAMRRQTEPPPLTKARMEERAKALADIRAAEAQALNNPGWIDKAKGIARAPIDVAMEHVLRAWQDPKAAKADLVARVQKATAVAPAAPAKPSEFE
jgi:hypothetical protein